MAALSLDSKHQNEIQNALNDVESRIHGWFYGSKYTKKWKFHKSATNEYLNINCKLNSNGNGNNKIKNITIHSLDDENNKKYKVWRAEAYLPFISPQKAVEYYIEPRYHLAYDDMNTMERLQHFKLEMDSNAAIEYGVNVAITNPKLNGLISHRLSVNIACAKYSAAMKTYCYFGRYMKQNMMKQLKEKLNLTVKDMKHTLSKNFTIFWGAKPVTIDTEIGETVQLTKITYILQLHNGGWIPQWAVELGLIDQHMIVIFKQITKWINENKHDVDKVEVIPDGIETKEPLETNNNNNVSSKCENKEKDNVIDNKLNVETVKEKAVCDWVDIAPLLSVTTESNAEFAVDSEEEFQDIQMKDFELMVDEMLMDDAVYVDDADTMMNPKGDCVVM